MKKILTFLVLSCAPGALSAAGFELPSIGAAAVTAAEAAVPRPAPAARAEEQVPQDLVYRFRQAYNELSAVHGDLTWVRSDLNRLESRARQIAQINYHDAFFQSDLRRAGMDMSRRFNDMQRAARDVRDLLALAQKSPELNGSARDMAVMARDILGEAWPGIEDAAQRLEWEVRSAKPEAVGYDAQWTAMDISRYARQFSDQARAASSDAQELVRRTQP